VVSPGSTQYRISNNANPLTLVYGVALYPGGGPYPYNTPCQSR
jgi:hypothetical protein